ncbi:uncharacterized protein LOC115880334 [Sitophilus oryzae]|uniref:Uncharacterized protein LOC115880334 n=1 Tax=Sitophilus oryzae TaxID=7048 RepID=A0A6J2XPG2_SITOR|nr:uncharacterized protein LOC115880334 [Sitophilus oryzae]XP_030753398.1 uncharacterized protein LOC115880334 [Sitophilus oryzae]
MTRWSGEPPRKPPPGPPDPGRVTDDPLAALGLTGRQKSDLQVYAVSRVNPLFNLTTPSFLSSKPRPTPPGCENPSPDHAPLSSATSYAEYVREKSPEIDYHDDARTKSNLRHNSVSSGYSGSSSSENGFGTSLRPVDDSGGVVEQNGSFVKSIRLAGRGLRTSKTASSSQHSTTSGAGTLTTIPEGQVDTPIPLPVWPGSSSNSYRPESLADVTLRDLLVDLLTSIGEARTPEDALRQIDEKIRRQLDELRSVTEEDMRRLCVSLSRGRQVNSVLRALRRSPSSDLSTSSGRVRTCSGQEEELYHIASGSSSSGFSDSSPPGRRRPSTPLLPQFYARKPSILLNPLACDDTSTVSRGIRNALIYGTLCRQKTSPLKARSTVGSEELEVSRLENKIGCDRHGLLGDLTPKLGDLGGVGDEKPSVWELYYGVRAEGCTKYGQGKPTDVPVFPGGRPEADFTLDVPRSELLSKRLKDDKKWRFRCRLLTSFLGLVFFLLSVMAVSLMLTRGKRMFGSMV